MPPTTRTAPADVGLLQLGGVESLRWSVDGLFGECFLEGNACLYEARMSMMSARPSVGTYDP